MEETVSCYISQVCCPATLFPASSLPVSLTPGDGKRRDLGNEVECLHIGRKNNGNKLKLNHTKFPERQMK